MRLGFGDLISQIEDADDTATDAPPIDQSDIHVGSMAPTASRR